ncbi:uncharacterized protein K452DRAFT_290865 [Aplosporella prunicola CBS 121167]|uniref:Uncharacterized protein n=1 Tax=Aplosporella prunicola CBS 121167 TaxID=1176127 RepID=A0A6A6B4T2_9PEZI|nr:uncharacterized protein K452DRAFT_290865 [Aplosporella prunicola CBS 121167]KAF2138275.1 hypothetical protein K452DRAFT_290865 [Aplosporella prunicola CBS 121167]
MATVRDSDFWKRFSAAVHLDEEATAQASSKELAHSDSWLAREQVKRRRRSFICWIFWVGFAGFVTGVVVLVFWFDSAGFFKNRKKVDAE